MVEVSKAILDWLTVNGPLASSDEGLALCILFNNRECFENYDPNGPPGVKENIADFLKGVINV